MRYQRLRLVEADPAHPVIAYLWFCASGIVWLMGMVIQDHRRKARARSWMVMRS
ncbi:hypothetical protein SAMN05519104_7841 [Rhizobiales bacterium GAS188]|nr:hypothetical protein SAMN05519104_7841 [Rhizobiales bacterium GAS188]